MQVTNKIKLNDVFVVFNLLLFLVMCVAAYYDRFLYYRGRGNIYEFIVYAFLIVGILGVGWWYFRRFTFPLPLLILLQLGILAHYAGGFLPVDGQRLYDVVLFDIRYDKFVHFLNALVAATFVNHFFIQLNVHIPKVRGLAILLIVLGLGAFVEIVEYLVLLSVPGAGVGGYDNNMQDLIANFLGCLFFLFLNSLAIITGRVKTVQPEEVVS